MISIADLLRAAAPEPRYAFDMHEIRRRAERRTLRRRIMSGFAALSLVIGGATTGTGLQSVTGSGGDRVPSEVREPAPAPVDRRATEDTARDEPETGEPETASPSDPATDTRPVGTGDDQIGSAVGVTSVPVWEPAPTATDDTFPVAERCQVDNIDLPAGETRICRFTATTNGSAGMFVEDDERELTDGVGEVPPDYPAAEVHVRRGSDTYVYTIHSAHPTGVASVKVSHCGSIEPGDLVEVRITATDFDRLAWVGAGRHGAPEGDCAE